MINDKPIDTSVYTDFSGFESMRKAARENSPEAVKAVAKQMEGVFLNMMLSSMREANQLFTEDSMFSSKDVRFFQQMLDQQLSVTLSESKGLGLADAITRQIGAIQNRRFDPDKPADAPRNDDNQPLDLFKTSLERYRVAPVPATIESKSSDSPITDKLEGIFSESSSQANVLDKTQLNNRFEPISPQDFIDKIMPYAKRSAAALGVPVEGIVAQAALETGWGRHMVKHADGSNAFNFFGIKASSQWQGDKVNVSTTEYRNGIAANETASFRSYSSLEQAFQDYSSFLQSNPRYQNALDTIRQSNDAKSWGSQLQQAGYATDPNYGKKIASIVSRLQKDGELQLTKN